MNLEENKLDLFLSLWGDRLGTLDQLKNYGYWEVAYALRQFQNKIPIIESPIPGGYICRARENIDNSNFNSVSDISYIPNEEIIKTFGRFNSPRQSVFYGSNSAECAILEICKNSVNSSEEFSKIITVGKWKIKSKMNLSNFCIIGHEYDFNIERKSSLGEFFQIMKDWDPNHRETVLFIYSYFSNYFNKIANIEKDYYITCALFNECILKNTKLQGIIYPSVTFNSKMNCVALPAFVVDEYLELDVAVKLRTFRIKNEIFHEVLGYGKVINNTELVWDMNNISTGS